MQDLILQIALMGSLGVIVYLFAISVPRVGESEAKPNPVRIWISKFPLHHMDSFISEYKDKILRKTKIVVMKLENFINRNLNKDKSGLGGPKS